MWDEQSFRKEITTVANLNKLIVSSAIHTPTFSHTPQPVEERHTGLLFYKMVRRRGNNLVSYHDENFMYSKQPGSLIHVNGYNYSQVNCGPGLHIFFGLCFFNYAANGILFLCALPLICPNGELNFASLGELDGVPKLRVKCLRVIKAIGPPIQRCPCQGGYTSDEIDNLLVEHNPHTFSYKEAFRLGDVLEIIRAFDDTRTIHYEKLLLTYLRYLSPFGVAAGSDHFMSHESLLQLQNRMKIVQRDGYESAKYSQLWTAKEKTDGIHLLLWVEIACPDHEIHLYRGHQVMKRSISYTRDMLVPVKFKPNYVRSRSRGKLILYYRIPEEADITIHPQLGIISSTSDVLGISRRVGILGILPFWEILSSFFPDSVCYVLLMYW